MFRKTIFGLVFLFVLSNAHAAVDVNILQIDSTLDTADLAPFSYYSDGNLTIDFNVQSPDNNSLLVDLNYSSSSTEGTGTAIVNDLNTETAAICGDNDLVNSTACSWDFNINSALVSDGNYFILISISDGSNTDFNPSDSNFMVDNTAPLTSWDGNHNTAQGTDANIHLTCSDGTGSGCSSGDANTTYRLDTDSTSTISYGAWLTYDTNVLISADGNWAIDFNSTDAAGNVADANTFYVIIDKEAATLSVAIPTGIVSDGTFEMGVSTSEAATCRYSATDEAYGSMSSGTTPGATVHRWSLSFTYVDNGTKTYYVRCRDSFGNLNSSSTTISFDLLIPAGGGEGGSYCGDGACNGSETCSNCPGDCGTCVIDSREEPPAPKPRPQAGTETVLDKKITGSASPETTDKIIAEAGMGEEEREMALSAAGMMNIERGVLVEKITSENGDVSYRSSLTIRLTNIGSKNLLNVKIVDRIPKSAAENAGEIKSDYGMKILKDDPIVQFVIDELAAGESAEIIYYLEKEITEEIIAEFSEPFVSEFYEEEVDRCLGVVCDDGNPCTVDECSSSTGECGYTAMDDGSGCGMTKVCQSGECVLAAETGEPPPEDKEELPLLPALVVLVIIIVVAYLK
jgi:hypothetical protein